MAHSGLTQRLSSLDAMFLYFENEQAPLHIGGITLLEGEVPFEQFVAHVESKLPKLPRYRQKLRPAPLGISHPSWEIDPNFDIRRQIFRVEVEAPGTEVELQKLAARIFEGMMDRSKPLWELHVVYGLEGGRSALINRVHHAMVDGVSSVELGAAIVDITPETPPPPAKEAETFRPPAPPDLTRRVADAILDSSQEIMNGWMQLQTGLLNLAQTLTKPDAGEAIKGTAQSLLALAMPPTKLPFNRLLTGRKSMVWSEFSFADARAIRAVLGGTVNDVALTVLSGAVARYAASHGQSTKGGTIRIMVPVSMRREEQRGALGNLVSILPVEIPLDLDDPIERFRHVMRKTEAMKTARVAEGVNLSTALMATVPAPIQALTGGLLNRSVSLLGRGKPTQAVTSLNMVCTNIPGPQVPLYLLGKRVLAVYPYVPTVHSAACNCAIISYAQKLTFGLSADEGAMPDVQRLNELVAESFAELRQAAGVAEKLPQATPSRVKEASASVRA